MFILSKDILGAFMFHGDDVTKGKSAFRWRETLAMIKLLLEPVNLLILDEPSNHLDMKTKDIIKMPYVILTGLYWFP
jgi:ATP-binding cassette subfamily F protein 3